MLIRSRTLAYISQDTLTAVSTRYVTFYIYHGREVELQGLAFPRTSATPVPTRDR